MPSLGSFTAPDAGVLLGDHTGAGASDAPASYFDPGDPTHVALLPASLRARDDLAALAFGAEADVLAEFTSELYHAAAAVVDAATDFPRYVWLAGYAEDAAAAPRRLADAIRREVANVVRWRAARERKKPGLSSETAGDPMTVKSYRDDSEHGMPPDFGAVLGPYRLRPPPAVVI